MWLPRAIGGAELPPLPFLGVIEELSRQDGSLGWCTVIPAGYGRLAGALEEDVARDIFGTGMGVLVGTLNPTGKAVAVPGGYRVTGRWSYGSSSASATGCWATASRKMPPATARCGRRPRIPVVPVPARRSGGVRHLACQRPARHRQQRLPGDRPVRSRAAYDPAGRFPAAAAPAGSAVCNADDEYVRQLHCHCRARHRAGRDRALIEIGAEKKTAGSSTVLRDKPLAQADLARAEALVGAARAYLFSELGMMWDDAVAGRAMSLRARATVRLAACHATQCAIQAVDLMYQAAGGAALFQGSRLERCFRDVHAAGQHIAVSMQANWSRSAACCSVCRREWRGSERRSGQPPSAGFWSPVRCDGTV